VLQSPLMRSRLCLLLCLAVAGLVAQNPQEVEITSEPDHHLVLENPYLRAYKVEVPPRQATLLHRHRHDYVFVTIGDADLSNEVEGWQPIELKIKDGETRFAPGNFAHLVRNLAGTPFVNLTIELVQDATAHSSPPYKWDEDRGLHVFNGGTQHILFVKDNVRVSEVELNPGATIPSHRHDGPHLLVAVSQLAVRSDVVSQGPTTGRFKSGDIKWLPGGYTHTLTNVAKEKARFVALEFPPQT
jgi:quercetin dioxygenase-like cupin family protein